MCVYNWREGARKTEFGSFQWCPMTGQEAVGTHWNARRSVWQLGNTFLLVGWLSTGTGWPGRWWSLHPSKSSKAIWIWSWVVNIKFIWSIWSYPPAQLKQVGPDTLEVPSNLSHSVIMHTWDFKKWICVDARQIRQVGMYWILLKWHYLGAGQELNRKMGWYLF